MRKQVRRFEQRGLAGAVCADEDIPTGMEVELQARKGAQVFESQVLQPHAISDAGRGRRASTEA
jgi:hypothetical protein